MEDIISIAVIIAFLAVVFRKRLAPLLRGRKNSDKTQKVEVVDQEASDQIRQKEYYQVVVFDVINYRTDDLLSTVINNQLEKEFEFIRNKGQVTNLDVVTMGHHILFLIKWHMSAGERK